MRRFYLVLAEDKEREWVEIARFGSVGKAEKFCFSYEQKHPHFFSDKLGFERQWLCIEPYPLEDNDE